MTLFRWRRRLLELNTALFLNAGLFDRLHLSFQLGQLRSNLTVAADEKRSGPENDNCGSGCELVI